MEIVNDRAMLRLMHVNDAENLFTIVEENKEIWKYLIAKMDSYQDIEQYVQVAITKRKRSFFSDSRGYF